MAAWPGRAPEAYRHRAMLDAVRHLVDNDIKWRAVPAGFPPWDRVYAFFRRRGDHALVKGIRDQNLTERHGDLRSLLTGDCAGEGGPGNQYGDRPRVLCQHGRHAGDRGDPRARFDCGWRSLRTGLRLRPYPPSHPGRCWPLSARRLRHVHGSRRRLGGRGGLPRFLAARNRRARGRPASP
ncbi:transposase [Streptomyces europaeiscabiei]|uniref:transposase n=1 Tax=Streptomyces europaeiscabiei TaxID=146819 RepID=UPI002E10CF9A|nr:transposase [Streptomyces europaeiscabiei]